jgi:hypothetical protein
MLRIGYAQSATDEGSVLVERTPHPPSLRSGTLSHKGRGETKRRGGRAPSRFRTLFPATLSAVWMG